jgi:AcrR family transcriptional regulator
MNIRIQHKHNESGGGGSEVHSETRLRVLDTAERLFADKGLGAVSVRDITQAAGVNLGAINYHFGTKEALIAEVFERRLIPLNQARLAQLDALEKVAGRKALKVEEVLDTFIRPAFEQAQNPGQGGLNFCKLMGRCLAEPDINLEKLMLKHFQPLMDRFDAAMKHGANPTSDYVRRCWCSCSSSVFIFKILTYVFIQDCIAFAGGLFVVGRAGDWLQSQTSCESNPG